MKKNYLKRFKDKISVKELEKNQPLGLWIFVISLNILGLFGYVFYKFYFLER
tara:strand:- start:8229 stop:8384 length:156 start_codon:yes stop_codon:yes gene_type:complete